MRWWKQPVAGDLTWCFYPQDQRLEPGPKPRPGLVLKVLRVLGDDEQRFVVQVAYGTSQKVDALLPGEFLLASDGSEAFRLSGLSFSTKFNLANVEELPYNDQWFAVPPQPRHGHNPKLGTLHPILMMRLRAARAAARS